MVTIKELIQYARDNRCSDIHLTAQRPPVFRKDGDLAASKFETTGAEIEQLIHSLLPANKSIASGQFKDIDFCYTMPNGQRQRVNIYKQQNYLCAAIRILNDHIPELEELHLPPIIEQLANEPRGLILVTGPTGSGKSTTLAAMINYINQRRACHILTAEDPIEYLHEHKKSMVHQREIGIDVESFAQALRGALREDPDVILVGEMRDLETISAAITAAETGHLVLSTLHTTGAVNTVDRIIDAYPAENQAQIRTQLTGVLKGVITQQLVPTQDGTGRTVALEIMIGTDAVLNLIRENKCHMLNSTIQTGARDGMVTLNNSLAALVNSGRVDYEVAKLKSSNKNEFATLCRR